MRVESEIIRYKKVAKEKDDQSYDGFTARVSIGVLKALQQPEPLV